MFRKSKALILCMMLCIGLLVPFESKAQGTSAGYEFYVKYTEPSTDGYNGYINVMYQAEGGYRLYTYFWIFQPEGNTEYAINNGMYMVVQVNVNSLVFNPITTTAGGGQLTLACYDWKDDLHILNTQYLPTLNDVQVRTEDYTGSSIVGYSFKGNVRISSSSQLKDVPIPEIYWNNSVDSYWLDEELYNILSVLNNVDYDTSYIISQLQNIYNENVSINQKLDNMNQLLAQIKAEEEESNTWLEKIFNWLKDSPEQEKQEATTQGNQSTSDATSAITDNSQGFIDSLGSFAGSMSYSGTECSWTFPAITLPAIPGVMDSYQLSSEQSIDFTYWVNQIPANLLLLIQSLLTIALIIYCFKEVYGTISYVLTLRGGGSE